MTVYAAMSVKGAPGASTTVLALACVWPRPVLVIDADPAGGDLATLLGSADGSASWGLLDAALQARRSETGAGVLWSRAAPLTADGQVRLLGGGSESSSVVVVSEHWLEIVRELRMLATDTGDPVDVLIDAGRLQQAAPWWMLASADVLLPMLNPTVAHVAAARRWLPELRDRVAVSTDRLPALGIVCIGDRPHPPGEVADALRVPVVGVVADDPATAQGWTSGGERRWARSRLLRSAANLIPELIALAETAPAWIDELVATGGVR
jgi:hypothetical protein